ncbi:SGNH/GDSL hydrolase family protein [Nonomuraea sp. K274]|uniref:histidine kinase n=1 Tax=Nonomuraea cypriaca TaxID=1187855 RepID=A0A931A6Z7_9ACTN|nr:ATP-binding protein [Nonomuraea cypriaca]MBF8184544.1 SGNH/GDSL hydrolase family protein [Nonomuraea cypriaca]
MQPTNPSPDSSFPQVTTGRRRAGAIVAVAVAATLAACGVSTTAAPGDGPAAADATAQHADQAATGVKVLWMGDSIAGAEAPALDAALKASGVRFKNATSDGGGGNIVAGDHPVTAMAAKDAWKRLRENLASFRPTLIAYQIATYDWGTPGQQLAAYQKLSRTAEDAGAQLVLVSAPPFKIDEFFEPHEGAIKSAPAMAAKVADVRYLDASELWGNDYAAGRAQRANDGIHSCQQGSAAFATWLGNALRHGGTPVSVLVQVRADADQIAVTVSDDGPGIPADLLPHVFDRFTKGDVARTRTDASGLGLAIATENARLHGGTLTAANAPRGGAILTLTLPRNPP